MQSIELKAKLDALTAELSLATKKKDALQVEVKRVDARICELQDGWHRTGEISACRARLEAALRLEADADKRRVKIPDGWSGGFEEFVVAKVTPKRIFLRNPGSDRTSQYGHDGKPVGYGKPIPPEDLAWILAEKGAAK